MVGIYCGGIAEHVLGEKCGWTDERRAPLSELCSWLKAQETIFEGTYGVAVRQHSAFRMKERGKTMQSVDTWINTIEAGGLQAALDRLPKSGGTVYIPAGTYELDRPVVKTLEEGQHLFIVGGGRASVLVNTNEQGEDLLRLTGVVGSWWPDLRITIRDLALVGSPDSGDALSVEYPNDTMIDGCFFIGHGGQAIRLGPQGTNVTVRDCWMRDCKRGVRAQNIHHLTLHGNQTRSLKDGQVQEEHVFLNWDCREVRVVNNHFAYGHNQGIVLDGTAHHVLANNTIEGFRVCIEARGKGVENPRDHCRDHVINANYLHGRIGVRLVGECNGFGISGNTFINNPEAAVRMETARGAGNHSLTGNVIRKSVFDGVFVPAAPSEQAGFDLGDAVNCTVSGNLFHGICPGPAIRAGAGGGGHLIASNRIVQNEGRGLDIAAPDCLVENNLV